MNGLAEIRAINDHAALKAEDDRRRLRGQKPKSVTGQILRKHTSITSIPRTENICHQL